MTQHPHIPQSHILLKSRSLSLSKMAQVV
uniref:Uncharacterized protein n=1 Tax=Anguilla anguilla TaxID=7936 RepID=A0A0E9RZH9_ANGAN